MTERREIQTNRLQGPVRVTIPAKVAYDLGAFQKSIEVLMGRLGCPACCSGADIVFQHERDFVVNEALDINTSTRFQAQDPDGDPVIRGVTVGLAPEVGYNLGRVQAAVERIVDRLGHTMCISGFDIAFRQEMDVMLVDRDLNVQAFGKSFGGQTFGR